MVIRLLIPEDAASYLAHRREALATEPFAFSASPEDDLASSTEATRDMLERAPLSVVFGALDGTALVGSVGIYRDSKRKLSHKAHLWGMCVRPMARGRGTGRRLRATAVEHARSLDGVEQLRLTASERAVAALRLYHEAGFRGWGSEPRSLQHGGVWATEHHLMLALQGR